MIWLLALFPAVVACIPGEAADPSSASQTDGDTPGSTGASGGSTTGGLDESSAGAPEPDPAMICARFIECAGEAEQPVTPLIEVYGEDGTCWDEFEATACVQDCVALAGPLEVFCGPSAPSCCPAPVVDLGATEHGCVDLASTSIAELVIDQDGPPPTCSPWDDPGAASAPDGLTISSDCVPQGTASPAYLGFYVWIVEVEQAQNTQRVPVCMTVGDPPDVFFDGGDGMQAASVPLQGVYGDGWVSYSGPDLIAQTDLWTEGCTFEPCDPFYGFAFNASSEYFEPATLEAMVMEGEVGLRHRLELEGPGPNPGVSRLQPWVYAMNLRWCFDNYSRCDPDSDPAVWGHVSILMNPG